ncbi:GNAT family N-acetyltransferase [Alteromonas sp. C1M14]|uniref:GNAT family N-acetyltransferase n=1 Tax=Alteromonas sp. C1M14 TaxID=2841567 RepID=UPI001C086A1E|nr:GNAT family N-acetyltransferase [Alteromonas sp. C1M14]
MTDTVVNVPIIEAYQVRLRPITVADLTCLRQWRNSAFVREKMVSTGLISHEQQLAWYKKIATDPSQMHWVIEYRDTPIGAVNVKVFEDDDSVTSAKILEPGLYIGEPRYQGNIVAFAPTLALYDYCFSVFHTQQFHASVKADNEAAIKYNQQLGYETVSRGQFVTLSLQKACYERQTVTLKSLLSRTGKTK